ncbi:MAG: hypothetical protein E7589_08540 [Ruminococcaceae bacterium]|nr:hypothetical protein [Oscillospiraceae bacterium]
MPSKAQNSNKNEKQAAVYPPIPTVSALRFEKFARLSVAGDNEDESSVIGTLNEKRLHAVIKNYLCDDTSKQEITVFDGNKKSRIAADVLVDGQIYEVQTGGFFPLRHKIQRYLAETEYRVTVVAPVAHVKYLRWIDPASGSISERHRSPKKVGVTSLAKELYWLRDFLADERFSIKVLLLEMEEFRMQDGWGNGGKRGSNRFDRIPLSLLAEIELQTSADYAKYFLPNALTENFTAADYSRASGIRGKAAYSMIKILCDMGLIFPADKIGRAQGYRKLKMEN